jgi:four helix bundle protein
MVDGERIQSYRDLKVWNIAVELTLEVYRITESFPSSERFGLTSQLRRAAVSVASNIAEGHARNTRAEYRNFVSFARASAIEIEVQLLLSERLGYVKGPTLAQAREYCSSISRMLTKLKRAL